MRMPKSVVRDGAPLNNYRRGFGAERLTQQGHLGRIEHLEPGLVLTTVLSVVSYVPNRGTGHRCRVRPGDRGSGGISPSGIERAEKKGGRESDELIMPPAALVCFVLKKNASNELRATFYGRRIRPPREQDKKKASTGHSSVVEKGNEGYYVGDWGFKSEKTFVSVSIGDAGIHGIS